MSTTPPKRKPSTLAADRFRAASRPLGAPVDLKPRVPHEIPKETVPVMAAPRRTWKEMHADNERSGRERKPVPAGAARLNDPWANVTGPKAGAPQPRVVAGGVDLPVSAPASSKPASKARPSPKAKVVAQASTRSRNESLLVTSLLATFTLLTVAVASVTVRGNMTVERRTSALTGTLAQVNDHQQTFRVLNRRFASWSELQAAGMKVPEGQRMVQSNSTASHWFVSLRDVETGVICSRTGELFDDGPNDRTPNCTKPLR
ncbi:MAG: hypothetical protein C0516_11240 [Gemmatimonas sp.]|nr:hypothetical protein [Gemmatimonas sp.]